jgi:hypothetical protein
LLLSHIGSAQTLLVLGLAMALVALVATGSRTMRCIPNFRQLVPASQPDLKAQNAQS